MLNEKKNECYLQVRIFHRNASFSTMLLCTANEYRESLIFFFSGLIKNLWQWADFKSNLFVHTRCLWRLLRGARCARNNPMLNPQLCLSVKYCAPSAFLSTVSNCRKKNCEDTDISKCTAVIINVSDVPCIFITIFFISLLLCLQDKLGFLLSILIKFKSCVVVLFQNVDLKYYVFITFCHQKSAIFYLMPFVYSCSCAIQKKNTICIPRAGTLLSAKPG